MKDELTEHLIDIDKRSTKEIEMIINSLSKKENVDEDLKAANQLKWSALMNNIKS